MRIIRMNNKLSNLKTYGVTALKWGIYLVPIALCSIDAYGAYDLDAGAKAVFKPIKKMFNDYYPTAIVLSGAIGAFMQREGDLRDKMFGFGKGAAIGWGTIAFVKAIFDIK